MNSNESHRDNDQPSSSAMRNNKTSEAKKAQRWPLTWGAIVWMLANAILFLVPLMVIRSLYKQYTGLVNNSEAISKLIERIQEFEIVDGAKPQLDYIVGILQNFNESAPTTIPLWIVISFLVVYVLVGFAFALFNLMLALAVFHGAYNWARITMVVLSVAVSLLVIIPLWSTFIAIKWLPLAALKYNDWGMTAMILYGASAIFLFLPMANRQVKNRKALRG